MNIKLAVIITAVFFSNTAWSDITFSAHQCQVVGPANQIAFHAAGTTIALANGVRVSCPLSAPYSGDISAATVYFSSRGGQQGLQNYIKCALNRTTNLDLAQWGEPKFVGIRTASSLVLENHGVAFGVVGANIFCTLQRGVKILGYRLDL